MGFGPGIDAALAGILGLLLGSFLNVVVYRLPKMLERQWAAECAELTGAPPAAEETEPFDLARPRSRCPACGHMILWYENIPVLSWLALRGRCSACKAPISVRYPVVELATGGVFAYCAWRWGVGWTGAAWAGFGAAILALALIDWDTTLLPDDITLPLVWAGLIAAALGLSGTTLAQSLWGAVAGYLSLWLVFQAFKFFTGKEGMGYGDFKLFAALGAWFGWQALVPIILMASVIGTVIGIAMKLSSKLREGRYVPFGPFLALGGLAAMVFGPAAILRTVGL
ncbi:A24 family peptidase [Ramlibacter sp.]|uniref:prepilin peptidase n=1 Tax=Ramlibacter sp. TaxID=1917967 RepID=UPI0018097F48|nr:A24 family peptidase [Ramlibacter sp.]MBA2675407.1 prepilin peptidase [Ramlibacter sp.]